MSTLKTTPSISNVVDVPPMFTVEPNEAVVLILFGKYIGTEKQSGFRWANPLYTKKKISLRVRNFDSEKLKSYSFDIKIRTVSCGLYHSGFISSNVFQI